MNAKTDKVAIIIPTMDRPDYMSRALRYYASKGFLGEIIVGDSSTDKETAEAVKMACYESHCTVLYHWIEPSRHSGQVIGELTKFVTKPYVCFCGDDDFAIVDSFWRQVMYLEERPEYVAVHGIRVNLSVAGDCRGRVVGASAQLDLPADQDCPVDRCRQYLEAGASSQYYLHRLEAWRRCYDVVDEVPSLYLGPELLPCLIGHAYGKIGVIDVPTTVFQRQKRQHFSWDKTSLWDLMSKIAWGVSVDTIIERLRQKLGHEQAMQISGHICRHCIAVLAAQQQTEARPCPDDAATLRQVMRMYPEVADVIGFIEAGWSA